MANVVVTVELDEYDYVALLTQANSRGMSVSDFALELMSESLLRKEGGNE